MTPDERTDAERRLVEAIRELVSATMAWRDAAYGACPSLVIGNEAVSRLAATLLEARRALAAFEFGREP